ncbi:MAG: hypothetical protein IJI21_03685 [Clostridia bacterium]|nr:hypothetical protein [Clostridia bacterium]
MVEFNSQVYLLSAKFMADYPLASYPELMYKQGRPYTCLLIETREDIFLCVPFRSTINHPNAYHFTGTKRSLKSRSGLDYSKTVVIKDSDYIDAVTPAIVDRDEYSEMMRNISTIAQDVLDYINGYVNHKNGTIPLHPREYIRKYGFSTLPYFDELLGLT